MKSILKNNKEIVFTDTLTKCNRRIKQLKDSDRKSTYELVDGIGKKYCCPRRYKNHY